MKMSEVDFYLEDYLLYCQNKNLSAKTITAYEQSLKLLFAYLSAEHEVTRIREVRTGHIRQYIAYVQEKGKYTVVQRELSKQTNFPENRTDYKKQVSSVTINNYLRNLKVFFNWLHQEGELIKNPFDKVEKLHTASAEKRCQSRRV